MSEQPIDNGPDVPVSVEVVETKFSATIEKPMFKVLPEGDKRLPVAMSCNRVSKYIADTAKYPNFNINLSPNAREWEMQLKESIKPMSRGDWLADPLTQGDWQQSVKHEGVSLKANRHGFNANGGVLTGEQALSHVQYIFGVGIYVSIPLWHSGIWVTIKAPMDSELLSLERIIEEEKLAMGRLTNGFVFANAGVYITHHLFNFIIDHIYDCTVKDYTRDMLRTLILQTDFQTLVWGLALSIYPDGWPVAIPCSSNPEKCMHIEKSILDIAKLSVTNNDAITPSMRKHMAVRNAKYTSEQIVAYQQGNKICEQREITIDASLGSIKMILSVPSIQKHVDAGDRWVTDIKQVINGIFDETATIGALSEYAGKHAKLTQMRDFSHWVKQIHIDDVLVMRGDEEIDSALDSMSTSDSAVEQFMDAIKKYIEDCTISFIAVSNFNCPKCGEPIRDKENVHPELIPIDMGSLFFILKDRRLMRVARQKTQR